MMHLRIRSSILKTVLASVCLSSTVVMIRLCVSWLVLLLGVQLVLAQLGKLDDADDDDDDEDLEDKRNGRNKNKPITSNVIPKSGNYFLPFSTTQQT